MVAGDGQGMTGMVPVIVWRFGIMVVPFIIAGVLLSVGSGMLAVVSGAGSNGSGAGRAGGARRVGR